MKWAVGAAGLVLVAAVVWWAWASAEPAPIAVSADQHTVTTATPVLNNAREVEARVIASPPSLRDTELDGEISWLPDGSVRIDLALRRRFDHLLSAIGEVSVAQVRTRLENELKPVASADRVARVLEVFDRYVKYLDAASRVQPEADLKKRLAQAHALRVETLGAEIARAFYEDEERSDAWAIERRELIASGRATPEKLAELDAELPPEARAVVQEAAQLQDTVSDTAQFEAAGLNPEERRKVREAKVGAEAAQRLGELDEQRARWNSRLEAFKSKRTALEPIDAEDQKVLDAMLERDFSEPERRRVQALLAE
ncbi:MAG: lipase secretion chaperone [Archangium sp.]